MARKKKITVPLLPLRGLVVYPTMVLHLDVGRTKSIQALEKAMVEESLIFLTTQVDSAVEIPSKEDINKFGTLTKVKQMLKLPNGTIRVLVEGLDRAKMATFIEDEDHFSATIEVLKTTVEEDAELVALRRTLLESFEAYTKIVKKTDSDSFTVVKDIEDLSRLTDLIASYLPLKSEQKQKVLEMLDLKERISFVLECIHNEQEIVLLEKKIQAQVKKAMERTQKEYYLREQMKVIQQELGDKDGKNAEVAELTKRIQEANMPENVLEVAMKELGRYERLSASSAESGVIRNYIEWLVDLPWTNKTDDTINLKKAEKVLNDDHYGLEKVKERILEYLAVQKLTNSLRGPILCLAGPPGVGKTSLAKSIATAVNRNFVRISLGGVRDESEIRGHRRTYVGAMPGRIIQGMKKAKTVNPVFLLDEIDKMSNDFRGDPSAAMLEVLDPEQNNSFSDHYIEQPYDLSNVLFIATANDLSTIPAPLRDRMEIIQLSGYTELEKVHIAKDYLVPKQMKEHGLTKSQLVMKEDALLEIIRYYTREAGVRTLERQIAKVCRKATRIIVSEEKKRVVVTEKSVEQYLGKKIFRHGVKEEEDQVGIATGLAYTSVGGDTLQIEVSLSTGKGKLILTGKLGDVMKESAQAAFSYVRSNAKELGIDDDFYEKYDIHIHVPEGAVPKDGPSAGITMTTALVSALTNKPIRSEVGMTGEVTLRGRVLPIGGLKEKSMSAHRAGLKKIIIPMDNERDLEDVPQVVKDDVEFVLVSHVNEVFEHALRGDSI